MGCTHSGYFAGEFLSTSSAGRTTDLLGVLASPTKVSIHVLREKDDAQARSTLSWASMISIHVLREEDDSKVAKEKMIKFGGNACWTGNLPINASENCAFFRLCQHGMRIIRAILGANPQAWSCLLGIRTTDAGD